LEQELAQKGAQMQANEKAQAALQNTAEGALPPDA
jgi:hypothetical protein